MHPCIKLIVALWFACLSALALAEAGHVEVAHGDVTITKLNGTQQKAKAGLDLDVGDQVASGTNAWAVLQMVDGASLTVRPGTQMRIDDYRYNADNPGNGNIALNLLKGALRSITGLIGKQNPSAYKLVTPTATIGIRGTDHETLVVDEASATPKQQPGTYDSVNAGETVLRNGQGGGEVAIQPGGVGFLHAHGGAGPVRLANRPAFFDRMRAFESRQGIDKVLGRLHAPLGHGAFGAPPDLRERLQKQREQRMSMRQDRRAERMQRRQDRIAEHPGKAEHPFAQRMRERKQAREQDDKHKDEDHPLRERWRRRE